MRYSIALGFVGLFLSSLFVSCEKDDPQPSEPTGPITTVEQLNTYLDQVVSETSIPGFSLAIVKQGNLAFQESFGFADIATAVPYTNQTRQPIGSISKTFIGAAVVKAIEEGYFTLDTEINDLLPFEINNPKAPGAKISVKHLVTHTSGLIDEGATYNAAYYIVPGENTNTDGAQFMTNFMGIEQRAGQSLASFLQSYYLPGGSLYSDDNFAPVQPGQVYNYSNIASSLAAYVVEVATGQDFHDYLQEKIFTPLGMNQTNYSKSNNSATLYFDKDTPLPTYANDSYPDGFVNTSSEDLSKYLLEMMQGASGTPSTLFSPESYELLFAPLLPDGIVPAALGKNHGNFWFRSDESISHDGSDPGLTTLLQFFENGQTGFFLLTNMDSSTDENGEQFVQAVTLILEAINQFLAAN